MKRFIKGIIFVIFACSSFWVGCSNKASGDKIQSINKSKVEKVTNENNIASKKDMYLEKLDKLEVKLNEELKDKYSSPKTQDMNYAINKEFKAWDNMLNEIYSILEAELSQEDMDKLREEEIDWINIKEIKSKEAAKKYKGGTIEPFMAVSSLVDSTKRRCYELVNEYMN